MTEVVTRAITEFAVAGRRLGRHVAHDPRSRDYPAEQAPGIVTTVHDMPSSLPLNQGDIGSCTGNAMAGLLACHGVIVGEPLAVHLYEEATKVDPYPGTYPPDDTGSAGLYVAKAAKAEGYCKWYRHAFGLEHALRAIVRRPVIIGIDWYSSFDVPGAGGIIEILPGATVRGGHEVLVYGVDAERKTILICNSWGLGYGIDGRVELPWDDFEVLLNNQGDVLTVGF